LEAVAVLGLVEMQVLCGHRAVLSVNSIVIPGRRKAASPESITTRACGLPHSRKKEERLAILSLREWPKGQARLGLWIPGSRQRAPRNDGGGLACACPRTKPCQH